jgi:hypothetical protein
MYSGRQRWLPSCLSVSDSRLPSSRMALSDLNFAKFHSADVRRASGNGTQVGASLPVPPSLRWLALALDPSAGREANTFAMLSPPPAPKPPAALASMTAFALVALLGFAAPASLAYPGGPTVTYTPNALGQATQAAPYASNASYHPNGAIAGYTLLNGIVHTSTQNTRGLPALWRDAGVVQDAYAFDANANVACWRRPKTEPLLRVVPTQN